MPSMIMHEFAHFWNGAVDRLQPFLRARGWEMSSLFTETPRFGEDEFELEVSVGIVGRPDSRRRYLQRIDQRALLGQNRIDAVRAIFESVLAAFDVRNTHALGRFCVERVHLPGDEIVTLLEQAFPLPNTLRPPCWRLNLSTALPEITWRSIADPEEPVRNMSASEIRARREEARRRAEIERELDQQMLANAPRMYVTSSQGTTIRASFPSEFMTFDEVPAFITSNGERLPGREEVDVSNIKPVNISGFGGDA